MNPQLLTCPCCDRYGFQPAGLRKHVCRGAIPGLTRRRLTIEELRSAILPARKAVTKGQP